MKREKKEKHSQAPSSLAVCYLSRKSGNQIPVFRQPHVSPDSPLTALVLKPMCSPFPVPVLHPSHVLGKAKVLGKVTKRGELASSFGNKNMKHLKRKMK